jgi:peptidase E
LICYLAVMMEQQRHILAIGGLSPTDDNAPIFEYALGLTNSQQPKLGFIGTASGDAEAYVARFHETAIRLACEPSHLPLFSRTPDAREWVRQQDVIVVGGGNTKSMLAVWKEWGLPTLLNDAWANGTVLAGWSAGAICWFQQGVTDSWAGHLASLEGLGFLPGSCCPHYSGEPDRRPEYHRLLEEGSIGPGIAIDDTAAVHFLGNRPHVVVAASTDVGAYNVSRVDGKATDIPLEVDRVLVGNGIAQ